MDKPIEYWPEIKPESPRKPPPVRAWRNGEVFTACKDSKTGVKSTDKQTNGG